MQSGHVPVFETTLCVRLCAYVCEREVCANVCVRVEMCVYVWRRVYVRVKRRSVESERFTRALDEARRHDINAVYAVA
jgi:hypothetical protein